MFHAETRCNLLISFMVVTAAEIRAIVSERTITSRVLSAAASALSAAVLDCKISQIVRANPTNPRKNPAMLAMSAQYS